MYVKFQRQTEKFFSLGASRTVWFGYDPLEGKAKKVSVTSWSLELSLEAT